MPSSRSRQPGGHVVERLVGGELDPGPLHVRVEVGDVDVAGAAAVGGRRDRPGELLLTGEGGDGEQLARLQVHPVDSQSGDGVETLVHGRRS